MFFLLKKMLPLAFWIVLIFGFDAPYIAVLTILAAIIHEGGHLIISFPFSNKRSNTLKNNISGFRINTKQLSYKEELLAALGGPLANLIVAFILFSLPLESELKEYTYTFGMLNIMTMISNMLPIENYDGHRALSAALYLIFGDSASVYSFLYWLSFIFSSIMTFLSLYIMLRIGEGFWMFAVFFSVTLSAVVKRQNNAIC